MRSRRRSIKSIFTVVSFLVFHPNSALASTPDASVAIQYVQTNLQFDSYSAFKLLHPDAQERMQKQAQTYAALLDLLKKQPSTDQTKIVVGLIQMIYGSDDPQKIRSMNAFALYVSAKKALEKWTGSEAIPSEIVGNAKVAYVGQIQETPSLTHIIVSITYSFGTESLTVRDAIRIKPVGEKWLVDGTSSAAMFEQSGDLIRLVAKSQGLKLP